MKYKVYIEKSDDRDTFATILIRNGYTVRQGREKTGNKYLHYIEYWRVKVIFTIKTRLPGLNDYINACRHNKYKGNELKQNTDDLVGWYIKSAKLKPIKKPVKIKFIWHEKSQRRDPDNIASAKKIYP